MNKRFKVYAGSSAEKEIINSCLTNGAGMDFCLSDEEFKDLYPDDEPTIYILEISVDKAYRG